MTVRYFDPQLTQRGTRLVEATAAGRGVWRVIRAEFWDVAKSAGKHHIYVDVFNEQARRLVGVPLMVRWSTGFTRIWTEAKIGEVAAGNFPMTPGKNAFSIRVDDGLPSDEVTGIGMGAETPSGFNPGLHTSTFILFQRLQDVPPPTIPDPPTEPPVEPNPDLAARLAAVQARLERGQADIGAAQAMLQQVIGSLSKQN